MRSLFKKTHRLAGIILLLPLCCWAITGTIFLTKPGYGDAYEKLHVKQYPLSPAAIESQPGWLEVRRLKSILGEHLLVKTVDGWNHLNSTTLQLQPQPDNQQLRQLLHDAFTQNADRYGTVIDISDNQITTSTGVTVSLDWSTLSLRQHGDDTRLLGLLYKVHYLQWTGNAIADKVLGVTGLILLFAVTLLGWRLSFGKRAEPETSIK